MLEVGLASRRPFPFPYPTHMKVTFTIDGVPPKKDGANSMWRKPAELSRLKAFRIAACAALDGRTPPDGPVSLTVRIYAPVGAGDLDNFATGICDALMAVHPRVPVDPSLWAELPDAAKPDRAIAFRDDSVVSRLVLERLPVPREGPRYEVELKWNRAAAHPIDGCPAERTIGHYSYRPRAGVHA